MSAHGGNTEDISVSLVLITGTVCSDVFSCVFQIECYAVVN